MVLDRRLSQDDNRGLGQGLLDNKLTASLYHLLLEDRRGVAQVSGALEKQPSAGIRPGGTPPRRDCVSHRGAELSSSTSTTESGRSHR